MWKMRRPRVAVGVGEEGLEVGLTKGGKGG